MTKSVVMFKKNKHYFYLFFSFMFFLNVPIYAQDGYTVVTRDFEAWSKVGMNYHFNQRWRFSLDQGLRFRQDASLTDQVFTNVGFTFKPIKPLKFNVDFRYIYDRGDNLKFDNDFRFNMDVSFKQKINRFSIIYRLRYQGRNEIGVSSDEGDVSKRYLRFRTQLKYNIKDWKFDPYISGEIFRDMTRYTGSVDLFRFGVGTSYQFKKFGEIGGYYRVERGLGVSYPKTTHIVGLQYVINLKSKK